MFDHRSVIDLSGTLVSSACSDAVGVPLLVISISGYCPGAPLLWIDPRDVVAARAVGKAVEPIVSDRRSVRSGVVPALVLARRLGFRRCRAGGSAAGFTSPGLRIGFPSVIEPGHSGRLSEGVRAARVDQLEQLRGRSSSRRERRFFTAGRRSWRNRPPFGDRFRHFMLVSERVCGGLVSRPRSTGPASRPVFSVFESASCALVVAPRHA